MHERGFVPGQLTCMSSLFAQCLMARSLSRRFSCHTAAASFQVAKVCDTVTLLHTWTNAFMRACRQECQPDNCAGTVTAAGIGFKL